MGRDWGKVSFDIQSTLLDQSVLPQMFLKKDW